MFVRLRRLGRGLHENFLGCGLFGGVCSFLRGEGDHMSRAAVLRAHGAALGVHDDSFPPAGCCLVAGFEGSKQPERTRPASRREASMGVIYSFLYILHMPEQTTAPEWGFP